MTGVVAMVLQWSILVCKIRLSQQFPVYSSISLSKQLKHLFYYFIKRPVFIFSLTFIARKESAKEKQLKEEEKILESVAEGRGKQTQNHTVFVCTLCNKQYVIL